MSLSINILTWNISWGCMTANQHSHHDQTAQALATHCYQLKQQHRQPLCLQNVCSLIDLEKRKHDLIAFQEASNWKSLLNNSHRLSKMKYVRSQSDSSEIITFYNPHMFSLLEVSKGQIEAGRPCHLLLLSRPRTNLRLIVINVHNSKGYSDSDLETGLSKLVTPKIQAQLPSSNKNVHVIIAGDFNDHGYSNYWKKTYPFKQLKTTLKKMTVSTKKKKPPLSCCVGKEDLNHCRLSDYSLYGDYILVSSAFKVSPNNHIHPGFNFDCVQNPTSDHLPISMTVVMNGHHKKKVEKRENKKIATRKLKKINIS